MRLYQGRSYDFSGNPTERYNTIGIIIRPVIMKNRLILFIYIIINLCTISVVKGAVQKVG